jgi:hypothetical protein
LHTSACVIWEILPFPYLTVYFALIPPGEFDDLLDGKESSSLFKHDDTEAIKIVFREVSDPFSFSSNGSTLQTEPQKLLEVQSLTLQAPRSRNVLFTDLSLEITLKNHLLVSKSRLYVLMSIFIL